MFSLLLRSLWLPERKVTLLWLIFGNIVFALLSLVEPLFFREIIDTLIGFESEENPSLSSLVKILLLWVVVGIALLLINSTTSLYADRVAHLETVESKRLFFTHVLSLSFGFHSDTHSGKILKKFTRGTDALFWLRLDFYRSSFANLITVLFLIPLVLFLHWQMGITLLFFVFIFLIIAIPVMRHVNVNQKEVEDLYTEESAHVGDTLGNISVIKSFSRILYEIKTLKNIHANVIRKQFPILNWWALLHVLSRMASTIVIFSLFFVGSSLFLKNQITIGEIVMFVGLSTLLLNSLEGLLWNIDALFYRIQPLREYFKIIDTKPDVIDRPNSKPLPPSKGLVEWRNVTFSHESGQDTLKNISFSAKPGEIVALVGHTGAGKSTIANLLCRFFEPQKGEICIDGVNIQSVTQDSLRQQIGMVFQENSLFHSSILDNIRVGKIHAIENEVRVAAEKAYAWEFIKNLPKGLHTIVGERGVKLSGGERQRVAIARVILKNPPILILDEATSALDAITEKKLQDALETLMKGRTTFIIAHRLSTIRKAHQILVLEKGKIVEQGNYKRLLEKKGLFYQLVEAQTAGFVGEGDT